MFCSVRVNFWTLNPLDHDDRAKQVDIDVNVSSLLQSLFGDILCRQVTVLPFLRVGLVCVLHHKPAINNTCHDGHSIVKLTAIYTSPDIADLECFVSVRVPLDKGNFANKLTGIPPHVDHLAAIIDLKGEMAKVEGINDEVSKLGCNPQKVSDDESERTRHKQWASLDHFFILMMESFNMLQLADSFSSAHYKLHTDFGILETK